MKTNRPPALILESPTSCCGARILVLCAGVYKCPCGKNQERLINQALLEKQERLAEQALLKNKPMAQKSVEETVKEIVIEQLGVKAEQVTPQAKFVEDLGADSLDAVELTMAVEEEFDIEIPDEDIEKIQTVGQANAYIEKHKR